MAVHKISKGLTLPILGEPQQVVEDARPPKHVALLGSDYIGMKPTMHVQVGDEVRRGQLLFEDKKTPGVRFTAPAEGKVAAVHRGERRAFQSLVIETSDAERAGKAETVAFESFTGKDVDQLSREDVKALLLESGLWPSLRRRPFERVAQTDETPHSIFVTAADSNPLAASVDEALAGRRDDFVLGVRALAKLTDGPTYVCRSAGTGVPVPDVDRVSLQEFAGPHPAGTVGLHIHTLDPVDRNKVVWHVGYQDVAAIGTLVRSGQLNLERVIALAGPPVKQPRLLRTRLGASTEELLQGEVDEGQEIRPISGSVLSGVAAKGEALGYLGRFDNQVSVLVEGREREFLGWLAPGFEMFSTVRTFLSTLLPGKKYPMTTSTNGSPRAIVPIGMYENVMPLDILPTFLLKSLVMGDVERAVELGCLELAEEDLALCTFVCPGKTDFGPHLRNVLTTIEKEG